MLAYGLYNHGWIGIAILALLGLFNLYVRWRRR